MYCSKCGKSYQADFKSCPFCKKKETVTVTATATVKPTVPIRDSFGDYRERVFARSVQLSQADLPLRLAAMMIDLMILIIPFSVLIYFTKFIGVFLGIAIGWAYYALLESSTLRGTIGKFALRLEVTNLEGQPLTLLQSTKRYFAHYLSVITFGIGFIILAFNEKKQAVHDLLTDCMVLDAVQQNKNVTSNMMEESK